MLQMGASPHNTRAIKCACTYAYRNIVDLLLEKGCTFIWDGFESACLHGHTDLVEKMLSLDEKYPTDEINKATSLNYIFATGNLELVQSVMKKHPFKINWNGIVKLFESGNTELIDFINVQFPNLFSQYAIQTVIGAFQSGIQELIDRVIAMHKDKNEQDLLRFGLKHAAAKGHDDIVINTIKKIKGVINFKEVVHHVLWENPYQIKTLKLLLTYDSTGLATERYSSNTDIICRGGHEELLQIMIETKSLFYIQDAFTAACIGGHLSIMKKLLTIQKFTRRVYQYGLEDADKLEHIDVVAFLLWLGARNFTGIDVAHVPYLINRHSLSTCFEIIQSRHDQDFYIEEYDTPRRLLLKERVKNYNLQRKNRASTIWNICSNFVCKDVCNFSKRFIGTN